MAKKERALDANGYPKFTMRDNIAYAAGDFGCNMSFALKGTMAIFWTQFMGLELWYSLLLVVVQVWDAVDDLLIGAIIDADHHRYKRNKFLQYIWIGSVGLIIGGACCFVPLPNAPLAAKCAIFVGGYVIWDAFYTVANVPYGSLLGLISEDPGDRASLSAFRSVGSLVGNMATMAILPVLIYDASNNIVGQRVFLAALIMGFLGFLCFQFMIKNTIVRVNTDVKVDDAPRFNVITAVVNFAKNRPAMGATLAAMGMFLGMQGASTATAVMFQSYFKNAQISGLVSMFTMIPMILFTPLARRMVNRYGKKELSIVGAIVSCAACTMMLILPITPDGKGIAMYMVCQLVNALGLGVYSTVSWAMMGDAIDYNEWKTGTREEGTVYAIHSFFRKLAQGLGPAAALVVMTWLGYVGSLGAAQSPETALNMRYFVPAMTLFSALLQLVGLGLIYNLDKKTTAVMKQELDERHA